ncbi:PREDICTED: E3 ubiquitin/ISG15 ligase TRIM25-like [Nanorana parkeri]|uniref:E3 ubiquitin/ISG15 ligase TRIM25-like n=1 Tax=Nanorana parkeri TaxID=125878 RepID=UPI0008546213|nr:PREDICTED: E3 ubiquitin/ISG15 ligase TRIM25-like [Nanorana parkeri]
MASGNLRAELECSVCLNIYTDPVTLRCGHNSCRDCIGHVLDTQERSEGYSCPECRDEFQERPALHRNITVRNIEENFLFAQPDQEESRVLCTQCIHTPVPAVKSCLLCEASLCDNHLRVHSKSPEHVLCDLTTSLENRKCSVHKKILEYYCSVDGACICVSCSLEGAHHGHQVKMLAEASKMRKEKLKTVQQKLMTEQKEAEKRIYQLQKHKRKVLEKAEGETTKITVLLGNLRRRLEDLEKRVLREISGQAERISIPFMDMIRKLETKKNELSRKMRHIEELCNMTDPLTVLQGVSAIQVQHEEVEVAGLLQCRAGSEETGPQQWRRRLRKEEVGSESTAACRHTLGQRWGLGWEERAADTGFQSPPPLPAACVPTARRVNGGLPPVYYLCPLYKDSYEYESQPRPV